MSTGPGRCGWSDPVRRGSRAGPRYGEGRAGAQGRASTRHVAARTLKHCRFYNIKVQLAKSSSLAKWSLIGLCVYVCECARGIGVIYGGTMGTGIPLFGLRGTVPHFSGQKDLLSAETICGF